MRIDGPQGNGATITFQADEELTVQGHVYQGPNAAQSAVTLTDPEGRAVQFRGDPRAIRRALFQALVKVES